MFKYYFSLCAIIKNEGLYLLEWIEYHRMVGVEHFYIYDNASTGGSNGILSHYIEQGIVNYVFWPQHSGQQVSAYQDCVENHKNDSYWIGFVDLDEFIVPLKSSTIPEFLQSYEGTNGLGINWIIYGTSGHNTRPQGLQIENYSRHSEKDFPANKFIKTIADPRKIKKIESPHYFLFEHNSSVLDENLAAIGNAPKTKKHHSAKIRINHYFTRSGEDIVAKLERGRTVWKNPHEAQDFYCKDRNEIKDPVMEQYVPELKRRVNLTQSRILRSNPQIKFLSGQDLNSHLACTWEIFKFVIERVPKLGVNSILEIGRNKLMFNSDFVRIVPPPPEVPWPIMDKRYDLLLALDILDHPDCKQKDVFLEIKRIAKMAMVSVCLQDGSDNLMKRNIAGWTDNLEPVESMNIGNRIIYLFNFGKAIGRQQALYVMPIGFNWRQYVANYPDLQEAGINTSQKAEDHWMRYGFFEKRNYREQE